MFGGCSFPITALTTSWERQGRTVQKRMYCGRQVIPHHSHPNACLLASQTSPLLTSTAVTFDSHYSCSLVPKCAPHNVLWEWMLTPFFGGCLNLTLAFQHASQRSSRASLLAGAGQRVSIEGSGKRVQRLPLVLGLSRTAGKSKAGILLLLRIFFFFPRGQFCPQALVVIVCNNDMTCSNSGDNQNPSGV